MNSFKNRKLVVAFPSAGTRQTAFGAEVANNKIDKRHPQTTPTYPSIERTREQTKGCSGEYIVKEEINGELMRLRYGFTPSAQLLALWAAFGYGAAAAPTGTAQNETQTITATGAATYAFTFEGLTGTTSSLPQATTAAQFKAALEKLDSIKPGNVNVTGTTLAAPGLVVEFKGDLANANVPLIVGTGLTTVTQTAAGGNKLHPISRSTLEEMTLTSLIIGFEGDSTSADKYPNIALNSINVTVPKAGKATCEIDLVGSAAAIEAIGYVKPGCVVIEPIYSKDCRAKLDGEFYTKKFFEMRWGYSNNTITDTEAQDWDSVDLSNLERGDRTTTYSVTLYGSKGDVPFDKAAQKPEPTLPVELHFGRPGNRFSWFAPLAVWRLDPARTSFVGSKNKSAYVISGEAFENETTGEVDYIEANIDQVVPFLGT